MIFLPIFSAAPRHLNLVTLQYELAAGRTSHLHSHQLTMLQCCSLSGGSSHLGVSLKTLRTVSLSPIAASMAQCSLYKAKPTFCLIVILHVFQPNITYPKTHPKGKTGGGSNFSPPSQNQHFCCAHNKAVWNCMAARQTSHKHL